jgi:DNA-binding MarR family transcriptional regulator
MTSRVTTTTDPVPLERVLRIAEFRANLRSFLRHSERVCARWDLTPQRYLLLLMIKGAPSGDQRITFTELADRLQLERNTVTELCARAERIGLIRRKPSQTDQRVVYLHLTKEGERRLQGALHESDELRRDLATAFDTLHQSFAGALRRTASVRR